jgi:hypothetical protein
MQVTLAVLQALKARCVSVTHEHTQNDVPIDAMDNVLQPCIHPGLAVKQPFTPLLSIARGIQKGIKFAYIKKTIDMYSVEGLALTCKHIYSCTIY